MYTSVSRAGWLAGLLWFSALPAARAVDILVDPVVAIAADGECSLIEAVINSENDAATHPDCPAGSGMDRIVLLDGHDYGLTQPYAGGDNGLPVITQDLEIHGVLGPNIRRAPGAPDFRLMEVASNNLVMSGVSLINGRSAGLMAGGGAMWIRNGSHVELTDVEFSLNEAAGLFAFGGAILLDESELVVNDGVFRDNSAVETDGSETGGGAIAQFDGVLEVNRSAFIDNAADIECDPHNPDTHSGTGGVLRAESRSVGSQTYIRDSTLTGNLGRVGGAIHAAATTNTGALPSDVYIEIRRSTLVGNDATGCPGAGLGDGLYVQEVNGGQGLIAYGSSILHGNGRAVMDQIIGSDCASNIPTSDYFSMDGNVLDPDDNCPSFGFDAMAANLDEVIDTTLVGNWYLPLRDGPAVDFMYAGFNCPAGSVDQLDRLRANGPGQGGDQCDAGAIELYYPVEQRMLTVTVDGTGVGSVTSDPAGIDCPGTCTTDFDQTEQVTLTPSTGPGSEFIEWGGDCSGSGACVVDMNEDRVVSAVFEPTTRGLDVVLEGSGSGMVAGNQGVIDCPGTCGGDYVSGTDVMLTVTVDPGGTVFQNFAGDCTGNACTVILDEDRRVVVVFLDADELFLDGFE